MTEFPSFYKPDRIGTLYHPDMSLIAAEAARAGLLPSAGDEKQARLLIVDMQVDFCHEQGSLFVPGAADDIRRLIEFIFRNAPYITDIICTMDSHLPFQIFHPPWWGDEAGRHPEPLTMITLQDLDEGRWRPLVRPGYSREYVRQLEVESKKVLTIWPYHVLLGGLGNALDPELWSAVMWHSLARKSQPTWLAKGRVPQTEHYSAIQPEIPAPGHPQGQAHRPLLEMAEATDVLLVAGEAESHCVLETLEDLVATFADRPEVLGRIYVLQDCMSAVQHPAVDFHALALERFEEFARQGVHFVNSTEPLPALEALTRAEPPEGAGPVTVHALQRMGDWERRTSGSEA
jgi:nicotinamidase/pyrazinamidase